MNCIKYRYIYIHVYIFENLVYVDINLIFYSINKLNIHCHIQQVKTLKNRITFTKTIRKTKA